MIILPLILVFQNKHGNEPEEQDRVQTNGNKQIIIQQQ